MTLTNIEYKEFLKTHLDLLFYVGHKKSVLPKDLGLKEFLNLDFQIKLRIPQQRQAFFVVCKLGGNFKTLKRL
jgi:hypothetical protein